MKDLIDYINESSGLRAQVFKLQKWVENNLDLQPFIDILGDYQEWAGETGERSMRCGSGNYGETKIRMDWYMCAGWSGDYIAFKNKPTNTQLNKCTELLKKTLKKEGFGDIDLEFVIKEHNPYYQPRNTYGIGVTVYMPGRK